MLRIAKRATGELGGGGAGGPIYGELTAPSVARLLDELATRHALGPDSVLLDVGSGRGLPNLVAAQRTGCVSLGIESEEARWGQSMHNLVAVLDAAEADEHDDDSASAHSPLLRTRVGFVHGDVTRARTLDPATHVYMFDTGFPTATLAWLAELFNRSATARALVSFQPPRRVVAQLGFDVEVSGRSTGRLYLGHSFVVFAIW